MTDVLLRSDVGTCETRLVPSYVVVLNCLLVFCSVKLLVLVFAVQLTYRKLRV